MICPKCKIQMQPFKVNSVEVDKCPQCEGVWVDYPDEKQVLDMQPEVFTVEELRNLRQVYQSLGKIEEIKYFACPHCHNLMWRKNYMSHSGIVVDKCRMHGTFYDKGELEKAIEFIKKGGSEYEKLRIAELGIADTQSKLVREITRVESTMYRLHWIGRLLSTLGF